MKKVIGVIMPYIIIGFVFLMYYIEIEYQNIIESLVIGLLIGIWILCITKCIGTLSMKIITGINCLVFIGVIIFSFLLDNVIIQHLLPTCGMTVSLSLVCYYALSKQTPKLHMSYKYSYKNKKRRYF